MPSTRDSMQAAGLVGAIRSSWALGADVALVNKPNPKERHHGPLHDAMNYFLKQIFQRPLLRDFQKQVSRKIRVEPVFGC